MTALRQRRERAGHVARRRHRSDGRSCVVALRAASIGSGTALLDPLADDAAGLLDALGEAQRGVVIAFLRDVVEAGERRASAGAHAPSEEEPRLAVPSLWA
jgi:hypothetical protein